MRADPFDLQRFVNAQEEGGAYVRALAELRAGRKRSHWIWFVFPQLAGRECAAALLALEGRSAEQILGGIDTIKLRSSMTLFAHAAPAEPLFAAVLDRYYDGKPDDATERLLA